MRSPYKEKVSLSLLFIRYAARLTLLAFILTIISLVVSFMPRARVMQAFAPSAEQIVKQAWEDAQESGAYEFATELVQTTYPAPRLDNVGRSSYDEILYVEGQANWHDQQLQMTLWQDGNVLNRDQAIDLRVEGTEAFGRVGDSEWEPVDNISGAFAPGQDLLAFLAGASNIQFVGAETRTTPVSISYARYSFNLDGGAFAVYMRDQFEQQLRSEGRLPAGIHLDTADIYRTMIGDGELWLDSDGLPLRLLINGEFPQQQNGQRIKLKVKTDFSNFDRQFIQTRAAPQTWGDAISNRYDSLARTTGLPRTSQGWGLFGSRFFSVLLVVGLGVLFLATAQRSKIVYRSFAIAMILSLVSTPLLQAASLHDFHQYMGQHNDGAEARHRQAEVEQAQAEAESATHWDPRRDPLAGIDALPQQPDTQPASAPSYTGGVETTVPEGLTAACPNANANIDADNDGLNQLQECLLNSVNGSGLESDSDHDNDGLTDLQESRLGTSLSLADSDEDGIRDDAEVQGYTIGNKTWYSNPMSPDSNEDGIVDTLECWSNPPTSLPSALDCNLDTDGDGLPDLFDEDNDGDGVFDAVDMSPFDVAGTFNADTPFKFTVDNLASQSDGKAYPIIADFQVRPDNAEHLTYALNVLDWPSGDSEGNVTTPSVTETVVFADFMNPTDAAEIPSAAQGDLRLVPMMEFKFDTKAVPMITAEKTYNFAENTVEGSLTLRQNGAHISVSGSVKTGKTYTLSIESGPCLAGNEAKHTDSVTQFSVSGSNINQTVSNKYLTNLANSQHVIYLYENADKSNTACQTMVDLPNGGVDGQMVDTELLQAYGVSIRDINGANVPSGSPTLSAYAPLNVVSDQSGGGRVAFMARMPFQPDQASQWGVNSEVRVVWMIQKLELSGNTSVIHTYQDDWKLTGLSMREDRGVKVGLIFEDPEKDSNTNYDNYLFQVAHILERSFVGGRTDVSLDDIKDEFDHQTNTDSPIRVKFANDGQWYETQEEIAKVMMTESKAVLTDHFSGVESPSLMFATESALRVRGLADVSANANSVYTINFVGSQVANSTSLSWAPYQYENNAWSAFPIDEYWETLDLKIPDAAFDSDPETTVGGKGLLKAYYLAIHNGLSTASNPEDFGSVVAAATDFPSFDEILADEWENVITSNQETIAEKLGEKIAKKIFKDKEETANSQSATGGAASEGTSDTGSSDAGSGSQNDNLPRNSSDVPKNWMGSVGQRFSAAVDRRISAVENSPRFQKWGPRGEQALGVASAAAGIANFIALSTGSKEAETAVGYATSGITIINSTIETVTTVKDTLEDVRKLKDVDGLKEVTKATRSSAKAGTITLIIGEAINYGVFITQMILTKTKFGSLAFNDALATAIANTIVAVALFVLALAVPVGTIISAIIGVIDALIAGLCAAADEVVQHVNDDDKNFSEDNPAGKRICAGISGLAGALVKLFIYSQRPLVGNVNSPNRLKIFGLDLDFVPGSEGKGFSTSSNLQVSLGLTNTIVRSTMLKTDNADACFSTDDEGNCLSEWQTAVENDIIPLPFDPLALPFFWQYSDRNAKKATFKYALQRNKSDIHKDLKMDDHTDEWKDVAGKDRQFYILRENISSQFDLQATGINRPLGIYLAEGYAVPNQECFLIPNPVPLFPVPPYIPICHIRADKKTKHIPLDSVKNDIFPPTLAAFYEAVSKDGGYAMAWGQTGDLTFPTIEDFDGDGLPYANDPNDSRWDTDGDGLNDNYEIARGYDPQDNDSDNDCLSDGQEARHGLNPLRADSDGDGLKDAQEIAIYPRTANCGIDGELGWSVTYQLNPELVTRMWSDPLSADQDGDNITDALEKNRGFSPYAADTDTVLTYEADLNETTAPSLLLRFDERVGAASFADTSGNGLTVRCVGNNCPVAGHQGRFLNALNFDGDDDYVTIADSPEFDFGTGPFAITMWLKKQDNSRADIFNWKNDEGDDVGITLENGKIRMLIRLDTVGGIAVSNNNTVDFGEWFHLAIVRNDQGAIKMYIDGIERGSGTSNADFGQMDVGTTLRLGANRSDLNGSSPTNLLEGMMDEVGIFPYALSAGQVVSVMNARYNLDDNIVGAGDSLTYTGRATNELLGRYAQGILTTDIEDAEISGTARQSFILEPRQSQTMAGTFNVGTNTPSGNYTVHQSALANVRDWKSQSGQAALWLNFESNRDDTSGNQPPRNATCSGSSCPGYRDGIRGRASSFDGSNDYLQVAHTTGLHPSRLTVSVWAKSDTTNWNSNDSLISKQHAYLLQPKFGTKTVDFSVYLGGDWHTVSVDLTEDIRNWHHYAATFDGTTLRLYVDGLLRESNGPFSGLSRTNTSEPLYIGRNIANTQFFDGALDDLRIFSHALSVQEINELVNVPTFQYKFDQTTGAPLDFSGNGYSTTCGDWGCPSRVIGVTGEAASFSGDDFIRTAKAVDLTGGLFTFSAWLYPTDPGYANTFPQGILGVAGLDGRYPRLEMVGNKLRFGLNDSEADFDHNNWVETGDILQPNEWNHLILTYDGNAQRPITCFYINGQDKGCQSADGADGKPPQAAQLDLGQSIDTANIYVWKFNVIDEGDGSGDAELEMMIDRGNGVECIQSWDGLKDGHERIVNRSNFYTKQATFIVNEDDNERCQDRSGDDNMVRATYQRYQPTEWFQGFVGSGNTVLWLEYNHSVQSIPFRGFMDEVSLYTRVLARSEVEALSDASVTPLHLPLDEPPGSTTFANRQTATGLSVGTVGRDTAVCNTTDLTECPTAGIPSLRGQAIESDDTARNAGLLWNEGLPEQDTAVSVWFKVPSNNDSTGTILNTELYNIDVKDGRHLVASNLDPVISNLNDDQWHHALYTYSNNRTALYLDNQFVASSSEGMSGDPGDLTIGKDFDGQIDDVQISGKYFGTPLIDLSFDSSDWQENPAALDNARCTDGRTGCVKSNQPGKYGQSIGFGTSEGVRLSNDLIQDVTDFTFAAWVQATRSNGSGGNWERIFDFGSSQQNYMILTPQFHNNKGLLFEIRNNATIQSLNAPRYLYDGAWHHVAVTLEGQTATLYWDGEVANSATITLEPKDVHGGENYLGKSRFPTDPIFNGFMDEVFVVDYALSQTELQILMNGTDAYPPAQRFYRDGAATKFAFEETNANATTFTNSGRGNDATCSNCPRAAEEGQVGRAVRFDGANDHLTLTGPDLANKSFSVSFWAKREQAGSWDVVFSQGSESERNKSFVMGFEPNNKFNCSFWFTDLRTETQYTDSNWNHWACTYDVNTGERTIYRNGVEVAKQIFNEPFVGNQQATLGTIPSDLGSAFNGLIDEFSIHTNKVLSPFEIRETYLYQLGQVEERQSFDIQVDVDKPNSGLRSLANDQYLPLQSSILDIQANDYANADTEAKRNAASGVAMVELGITPPSGSESWRAVPVCQNANSAWCPTFDPVNQGGTGRYILKTRATDRIGNQQTSIDSYTVYVDGLAPNLSTSLANIQTYFPLPVSDEVHHYSLTFAGTTSDPALPGGISGSGVEQVQVTLTNEQGLTAPGQIAELSGNNWTLDYRFTEPVSSGQYTILISAIDNVGNVTTLKRTVYINAEAPQAFLDKSNIVSTTIAPIGQVLNGTVNAPDSPAGASHPGIQSVDVSFTQLDPGSTYYNESLPEGLILHLPLDDSLDKDDNLIATDSTGNGHHGTCSNCPIAGAIGRRGASMIFDGDENRFNVAGIDLNNKPFSLSFFAKSATTSGTKFVLGQGASTTNNGLSVGYNTPNTFRFSFWGNDLDASVPVAGDWYHWAVTYDPGSRQRIIYRDGVEVAQDNANAYQGAGLFYIGAGVNGWWNYDGLLDDVQLYNRALGASEVENLYQGSGPVLHVDFEDGSVVDVSGWEHAVQIVGDPQATEGQIGTTAMRFDGNDYLEIDHPEVPIGNEPYAISAWIKPDQMGKLGIVGWGNFDAANQFNALRLGPNGFLNFWGESSLSTQTGDLTNQWHHVAATFDGTTRKLYLDGQFITQDSPTGHNVPDSRNFQIGRAKDDQYFIGLIDDLRIYRRALSDLEVQVLAVQGWQATALANSGTNVSETTWSVTIPNGLEGTYALNLRTTTTSGMTDYAMAQQSLAVDTLAPRLTVNQNTAGNNVQYDITAVDFNAFPAGLTSPCGARQVDSQESFTAAWYRALDASNGRPFSLAVDCQVSPSASIALIDGDDTTGKARQVTIIGNYAYVTDDWDKIKIYDISDPSNLSFVKKLNVPGYSFNIAVQGDYAYIADGGAGGLQIYNISNPASPTFVGSYNTSGSARGIAVVGDYAYIADYKAGLKVFDISDPGSLVKKDAYNSPGQAWDVIVSGDYAYLADASGDLRIINISDPNNITFVTNLSLAGWSYGLDKVGNLLYVAASSGGLQIVNVANPASPIIIGSYNTPGNAYDVTVIDDIAYVSDWAGGLQIIDVTNPASPALIDSIATPGDARSATVHDGQVYVADFASGLQVYSLQAPFARACDRAGNCATNDLSGQARGLAAQARAAQQTLPALGVDLDIDETLVTTVAPLTITASLFAEDSLKDINFTLNELTIYSQSWANGASTEADVTVPVTLTQEGVYTFTLTLTDWAGAVYTETYPSPLVFDSQAPQVTLTSTIFSTADLSSLGFLTLAGVATDTVGIIALTVTAAGNSLNTIPASTNSGDILLTNGTWQASWYQTADATLDGVTVPVTVTVTDIAGRTVTDTESVLVDLEPPTAVTLTVSANGQPLISGQTVTPADLALTWTESSDGYSFSHYEVGWTSWLTGTAENTSTNILSALPRQDAFSPVEGQAVIAHVNPVDILGNRRTQEYGPFFIDGPLTPDYVTFDTVGVPYYGWQTNGCSLIGIDQRILENVPANSSLDQAQQLYTTWNSESLRLAWTGADWDSDGDLFIYLDSQPDGTGTAYNPYDAQNVRVFLPSRGGAPFASARVAGRSTSPELTPLGQRWQSRSSNVAARSAASSNGQTRFNADYLIWVKDGGTAELWAWSDTEQTWMQPEETGLAYQFGPTNVLDTTQPQAQTDLLVPFADLGITDPENAPLAMVAFASQNNGLKLWSTMPTGNAVNSGRLTGESDSNNIELFSLHRSFSWNNLGDGVCPNTDQNSFGTAAAKSANSSSENTVGADVRVSVDATPAGITYRLLGDNLFDIMSQLPQFESEVDWASELADLCQSNPDAAQCQRNDDGGQSAARTGRAAGQPHKRDVEPALPGIGQVAQRRVVNTTAAGQPFDSAGSLSRKFDTSFAPVGNGQAVSYTIRLVNRGTMTATGLTADVLTFGPVRLPAGNELSDAFGQFYSLVQPIGDLAPGEDTSVTINGVIDTSFDAGNLGAAMANLDIVIYDSRGSVFANQIEWAFVNYELDLAGPVTVLRPDSLLVAPTINTIRGRVLDQSTVTQVNLEVRNDADQVQAVTCTNISADSGFWTCDWDVTGAAEGAQFDLRVSAIDRFNQSGAWNRWTTLTVDATKPTLVLATNTESNLEDDLIGPNESTFSGSLADNRLISGVEVCEVNGADEVCQRANINLDGMTRAQNRFSYQDRPESGLDLGFGQGCYTGNELYRRITVDDDFTVADLQIGLNISHPYRYDVSGWLQAPSGTWTALLWEASSPTANINVLLSDDAATAYSDDASQHDVDGPAYERALRPAGALSLFQGEAAKGDWILMLCDYFPSQSDGQYHHAELQFTAASLDQNTTTSWEYALALEDSGATARGATTARTLRFYALDSVGNRVDTPIEKVFNTDSVAPTINVTTQLEALDPTQNLNTTVLAGTISDATGVQSVQVRLLTPWGDSVVQSVVQTDTNWVFPFPYFQEGTYEMTVVAYDTVGNSSQSGPYVLEAGLPFIPTDYFYLPVVMLNADGSTSRPTSSQSAPDASSEVYPVNLGDDAARFYLPLLFHNFDPSLVTPTPTFIPATVTPTATLTQPARSDELGASTPAASTPAATLPPTEPPPTATLTSTPLPTPPLLPTIIPVKSATPEPEPAPLLD